MKMCTCIELYQQINWEDIIKIDAFINILRFEKI